MRVLLDHCVDIRFQRLLTGHEVELAKKLGFEKLSNGELLDAAESAGFEVVVTVDKNIRFQQNINKRRIALITLNPALVDLEYIEPLAPRLVELLDEGVEPGTETVIGPWI